MTGHLPTSLIEKVKKLCPRFFYAGAPNMVEQQPIASLIGGLSTSLLQHCVGYKAVLIKQSKIAIE